jgi:hypothetical protein
MSHHSPRQQIREIRVGSSRTLKASPVFDTYWRFAFNRQMVFMKRVNGVSPPWSSDPILAMYRFTNVYRASDRVSQYLIRRVQYDGVQSGEEVFFRTLLFKFFNRIDTWEHLVEKLGTPTWRGFSARRYDAILTGMIERGSRLYSPAYIMPSPPFGNPRKCHNHLALLHHMMNTGAASTVERASSLEAVFRVLRGYPSLGDFLAFQFAIDLNYSSMLRFSEMDFVVAGPGAKNGIRKCFVETDGLSEADVIRAVADMAEHEFARLGLRFEDLWGRRLQLVDCQNIFCEVDKYARVAHPEFQGKTSRTRIKQKYRANPDPLPQWYPPKWKLALPPLSSAKQHRDLI